MGLKEEMVSDGGGQSTSVAKWFDAHEKARKDCETFLQMRKKNETRWSTHRFIVALKDHYAFPYTSLSALSRYLQTNWPELYKSVFN